MNILFPKRWNPETNPIVRPLPTLYKTEVIEKFLKDDDIEINICGTTLLYLNFYSKKMKSNFLMDVTEEQYWLIKRPHFHINLPVRNISKFMFYEWQTI